MFLYTLTILTGSLLLFLIEPLIARYILPWFGGSPAVWSTCMLFFQAALLGGYAYAHAMGARLRPRRQALVHVALLLVSLAFLPITPSESWKPVGPERPELRIILLLAVTIGLPFALLSASAPLHQHWFSRRHPNRSPWRLYALSNLGSVLGLMAYPFLLEPLLKLNTQTRLWSGAYGAFALLSGLCALRQWRENGAPALPVAVAAGEAAEPAETAAATPALGFLNPLLWIVLSACGSMMLLATTNQMCSEVAVIPFLWIIPLGLYLLSFMICFDHDRWYRRWLWGPLLLAFLGALFWMMDRTQNPIALQISVYSLTMFCCCMICHGEMVRLKPSVNRLTMFYLMVALGGAIGGVFVNFAAPHLFSGYWEFHIGLFLTVLLLALAVLRDGAAFAAPRPWPVRLLWLGCLALILRHLLISSSYLQFNQWDFFRWSSWKTTYLQKMPNVANWSEKWEYLEPKVIYFALFAAMVLLIHGMIRAGWTRWRFSLLTLILLATLGTYIRNDIRDRLADPIDTSRNFYGVLRVTENTDPEMGEPVRSLFHGPIEHGNQFMDEERRHWPTTYYSPSSGINLACRRHPRRLAQGGAAGAEGLKIGVVGLGAGTLACLAQPQDTVRFYEINPEIERIAKQFFFYLKECQAKTCRVELGDARITLEQELKANPKGNQFDVLALDAFNGDAPPIHLLTREAFQLYWNHMRPDGIIAVDISNLHINLAPVVIGLAKEMNKQVILVSNDEDDQGAYSAEWALVTTNKRFLVDPEVVAAEDEDQEGEKMVVWTDQYSNLVTLVNSFNLKSE